MNRDYKSYDQFQKPFLPCHFFRSEEMENEIRNSNDGLYIVHIKNGKAKIFRIPEEEKALKDILVMFKSFVDKIVEKR